MGSWDVDEKINEIMKKKRGVWGGQERETGDNKFEKTLIRSK